VNIIVADNELPILETLQHKKDQHDVMKKAMQKAILQAKKENELQIEVFTNYQIPSFIYTKSEVA
jgi:hypothetical protein